MNQVNPDEDPHVFCEGCGEGFKDGMINRMDCSPFDDMFMCDECLKQFKPCDVEEYLKEKANETT